MESLDASTARSLFRYDPDTGILYRRHAKREKVGRAKANGYLVVMAGGRQYQVHRLAFLLMTGAWPEGDVDHVNRVKTDNRWSNLRDVTRQVNARNSPKAPEGMRLIGPVQRPDGWYVVLPLFETQQTLGPFATHAEAHDVFSEESEFAFWSEGKPRPRALQNWTNPGKVRHRS